jgi:hypothetical protein
VISQTADQGVLETAGSLDCPTVIRLDGTEAVVLATADGEVQLWTGDGVTTCSVDTLVEPVTDLARTDTVLRQAVAALNALRLHALATVTGLAERQAVTLAAIRDYAITAHRDGDICRDGLDEFLHTFDLGEYDPHVDIAYTITGSLAIAGSDEPTVRTAILQALTPNLAGVRWVRDYSAHCRATVHNVQSTQLNDGRPGFMIDFVLTGEYEVDSTDTDEAESDCRYHLRPSLAGLAGVVLGSVHYVLKDVDSDLGY